MTDEKEKRPHQKRVDLPPKELTKQVEARKRIEHAAMRVAKTESGQIFLRHIMTECGFKEPSTIMNPVTKEILEGSTLFNEAKRGLWLDVRKLIPVKLRNEIEKDDEDA